MIPKDIDLPLVSGMRNGASNASLRVALKVATWALDFTVVAITVLTVALLYHRYLSDIWWIADEHRELALMVAALFTLMSAIRGQYQIGNYIAPKRDHAAGAWVWIATFVALMAIGFATKTTDALSRGTVIITFVAGLPIMLAARELASRVITIGAKVGIVPARRVMLVGSEADVTIFALRYQPWNCGLHVAGTGLISNSRDPDTLDEELKHIVTRARLLELDDVLINVPWSDTLLIDRVIDAFMRVPVAIHLGPERIFDRFKEVRIERTGGIASLQLGRPPLSTFEIAAKRAFDIVLASIGLVVLAPMFLLVAIAIKLDSAGPVLFFQRRLGFNQRVFRIAKFRSMRTMDDGPTVRQATAGDPRITRVGHILRRLNIDELPQLINVLRGEMSLVGPRPHAIAHDREYDEKIALYARRHNVKPGITGWAQVHGLRGETDTDDKMRARVEHDLYYIDHWSLMLDVRIILLTVFTASAYRNAR